tara:strand:- start:86 stop:253 length:168 start_codon:yes stop_codon:yes gene_type:complete
MVSKTGLNFSDSGIILPASAGAIPFDGELEPSGKAAISTGATFAVSRRTAFSAAF